MRWRSLLVLTAAVLVIGTASGTPSLAAPGPRVLRVGTFNGISGQFSTIQAAVNAARPGDWILVGPGDYHEHGTKTDGVLITTPGIHLRGMERNSVIVDGTSASAPRPCASDAKYQILGGRNGIKVFKASDTHVENLTVCNFLTGPNGGGNEIWWNGGDGSGAIGMHSYSGVYLTASTTYTNGFDHPRGEYGIFASNADGPGSISYSYASNMGDAAYYVGACPNCNSKLDHVQAENSALGYSGTNSGGNLIITNSEFDNNKTGLVSNSQNNDDQPSPQNGSCPAGSGPAVPGAVGCTIFTNNHIHNNNNANVPGAGMGLAGAAPVGTGVVLAGTEYVTLYANTIENNGAWGALVADLPDQESAPPGFPQCTGGTWDPNSQLCYYQAFGNYVWQNSFQHNGFFGNPSNGDIGLATATHDPGNCFHDNSDPNGLSSDPPNIQSYPYYPCGTPNGGDMGVLAAEALCATQLLAPCPSLPGANYPRPVQVQLSPIPVEPSMTDPCSGVPHSPWCP